MFKSKEVEELYNLRMDRYMAAIRMQPTDRVPIAFNTCYFAEQYSGFNIQEIVYDPAKWFECDVKFITDYPEVDTFRTNIAYAPTWDVADYKLYRVPGREISPTSLQQFVESEWMKADEYREFIDDPVGYRFNKYFPRILGEYAKDPARSHIAFLKSGFLQGIFGGIMGQRSLRLKEEYGVVPTTMGSLTAPFDILSDNYRGLHGIMRDMFRQKDEIKEAVQKIMEINCANAVAGLDPNKQFPIFIATHKPCFMSPKQFDEFYWPTFFEGMMKFINAGYKFRVFLEGNWGPHWEHLADFPKGSVIWDVDNEADIFDAKKKFGDKSFITGGIPTDMFILGSPDEIRERVKLLCETIGKDGGWGPQGGGHVPNDAKPENVRALVEAINEYGVYDSAKMPKHQDKYDQDLKLDIPWKVPVYTPWETFRDEHGWDIQGDEEMIKTHWERLERMAFSWIFSR